jgi:hypothetical protein
MMNAETNNNREAQAMDKTASTVTKRDIEKAKAWVRRNMTFEKTDHGWSGEDNQTGEATDFYRFLYQAAEEAIANRLEQMARN